MLCRLLCLCCALALISTNTHAQSRFPNANGQALAGVSSFNASVLISWLNGDRERDLFLENVQSAFELSLRRDGIRVEGSAPNFLFCNIYAADTGGAVAWTTLVQFFSFEPAGLHRLMWQGGRLSTAERNSFTPDAVATGCGEIIADEWLKQNPVP